MIRSLILGSLFQFMLSPSGWRCAEVAASEVYLALQWGLDGGWVPRYIIRYLFTDNQPAALSFFLGQLRAI